MRKKKLSQSAIDAIEVRKMMIDKGIKPGELQRRLRRKPTSIWYALHGYRPRLLKRIARYVAEKGTTQIV